jgi:hypothetical protein
MGMSDIHGPSDRDEGAPRRRHAGDRQADSGALVPTERAESLERELQALRSRKARTMPAAA